MVERILDESVVEDSKAHWTAINKLNSAQNEQGKQLAVITNKLEVVSTAVGQLSNAVDKLATKIEAAERPDINLWFKVVSLVIALGAGLWAMAIRPIEQELANAKIERQQFRATLVTVSDNMQDGFNSINATRFTAANGEAQRQYIQEIMDREMAHLREKLEEHTSRANHPDPDDVLHELSDLRIEMYKNLSGRD